MPPLTQPPHCPFRKGSGVFLLSLDGQPDGFIAGFGLDDLLFEFVEPLARFQNLAYQLVATHEDAAWAMQFMVLQTSVVMFSVWLLS